jgi:hypothetical protein
MMNAMRWHKRPDELAPPAVDGTVPLVDAVLRVVTRRQLFTREEALDLLHQVEARVEDPAQAATVERIVASVDSGSADQVMVCRTDLVDPLLDIRLALCT